MWILTTALLLLLSLADAVAGETRTVAVPGGAAALSQHGEDVVVTGGDGRFWRLTTDLALHPVADGPVRLEPMPSAALPDGTIAIGARDISRAWLAGPTDRYDHGVLGDLVEASALRVATAAGDMLEYQLPPNQVIEDLRPRLADVDGDGRDEILVVLSHVDRGAALAAFGVRDRALKLLATTPPIGQPHRWLNPVGAADFDGDGDLEVALVRTPHIGGVLELYDVTARGFELAGTLPGFSNHVVGSRSLGMSFVADMNGDGVPDLVLPNADRRALRIVTFAHGRLESLDDIALPAPATTDIALVRTPLRLIVGLQNGAVAVVRP